MRAAIYCRVSTTDQNCARQDSELTQYCNARGWHIVGRYIDQGISGAKSRRPELDRLMSDARKRLVDVILVSSLDRWGRSVSHVLRSIEELAALNIAWISYSQGLDTSKNNPTGQLMLTILGAVAQFERELVRERVRSGMAQAAREGRKPGPSPAVIDRQAITDMLAAGRSQREIARELKVSEALIRKRLKTPPANPGETPASAQACNA